MPAGILKILFNKGVWTDFERFAVETWSYIAPKDEMDYYLKIADKIFEHGPIIRK